MIKSRGDSVPTVAGVLAVREKDYGDLLKASSILDELLNPVEDLFEVSRAASLDIFDEVRVAVEVGGLVGFYLRVIEHSDEPLKGSLDPSVEQGLAEFESAEFDTLQRRTAHGSAPIKAGQQHLALVVVCLRPLGVSQADEFLFVHLNLELEKGVFRVHGEVAAFHVLLG